MSEADESAAYIARLERALQSKRPRAPVAPEQEEDAVALAIFRSELEELNTTAHEVEAFDAGAGARQGSRPATYDDGARLMDLEEEGDVDTWGPLAPESRVFAPAAAPPTAAESRSIAASVLPRATAAAASVPPPPRPLSSGATGGGAAPASASSVDTRAAAASRANDSEPAALFAPARRAAPRGAATFAAAFACISARMPPQAVSAAHCVALAAAPLARAACAVAAHACGLGLAFCTVIAAGTVLIAANAAGEPSALPMAQRVGAAMERNIEALWPCSCASLARAAQHCAACCGGIYARVAAPAPDNNRAAQMAAAAHTAEPDEALSLLPLARRYAAIFLADRRPIAGSAPRTSGAVAAGEHFSEGDAAPSRVLEEAASDLPRRRGWGDLGSVPHRQLLEDD